MEYKKRTLLYCLSIVAIVFTSLFYTGTIYQKGYYDALTDLKDTLDVDFTWIRNSDGSYTVTMWNPNAFGVSTKVQADCFVEHYRNNILLSSERHAGVLTNIGADWIEDQISDSPSATTIAKWISVDDTDASGLSAASTELTSELATAGLTRAAGTYTSTGVGTWTVVKAFSVTDTVVAQTYGLQWVVTSESDSNLLCYDTSAVKNCVNGDTLTVTFTVALS